MSVASVPSVASIPSVASVSSVASIPSVASYVKPDTNYVLSEEFTSTHQYFIVFDDRYLWHEQDSFIPVKSRREVELFLLILGNEVSVVMDESAREEFPDIWDWLYGRSYDDIFANLKWSFREEDEVLDIIERIPLPRTLSDTFIKTNNNKPDPEKIDQEFVHKIHKDNVLISKPYLCGNMIYFNGFTNTTEFNIDHPSDHLEGIIIFEAARQAGNASAHLSGMPFDGKNVILKITNSYKKFLECQEPYIIRTIPAYKQRGGVGYCVYDIIQNGKSCVIGYFTVIAYNSKKTYAKFRNSKLMEKASKEKVLGIQSFES